MVDCRRVFDVVTGLWDSWAEDAFVRDVENGVYFDPERLHILDHKGEFLSVRGPLNIARPIQDWPVIVQAGASDAGRQLAAETAEVIFASGGNLADAQAFYADIRGRMQRFGRDPEHMKIMPGALVVVGDTAAEAREKRVCSTASSIPTVVSPRCRLRSAMTPRNSISTGRCPGRRAARFRERIAGVILTVMQPSQQDQRNGILRIAPIQGFAGQDG